MKEKRFIELFLSGLTLLAGFVAILQGLDSYLLRGKIDFTPIIIGAIVLVLIGVIVMRWSYFHLVRTGIINYSSAFTSDENAWDQAHNSLEYVGATGYSITERFLAWCEKKGDKLPYVTFFLLDPDDEEGIRIVADHRKGSDPLKEDIETLRQQLIVSLNKFQNSWLTQTGKFRISLYKMSSDFIPIWMYVIDDDQIYLGFPAPGSTGMNSPVYLCHKRSERYGVFDAYFSLLSRLKNCDPSKGKANKDLLLLAQEVVQALRSRGLNLTTVESCTGGGLANILTDIEGSSDILKGAFVSYSNEQKIALGVPDETIAQYSVYSCEVAEAMAAAGLKAAVKADIAIGITGSMSRVDPNNPDSQPGVIFIAVKSGERCGEKTISQKFVFPDNGDRREVKERAIKAALKMSLEVL